MACYPRFDAKVCHWDGHEENVDAWCRARLAKLKQRRMSTTIGTVGPPAIQPGVLWVMHQRVREIVKLGSE